MPYENVEDKPEIKNPEIIKFSEDEGRESVEEILLPMNETMRLFLKLDSSTKRYDKFGELGCAVTLVTLILFFCKHMANSPKISLFRDNFVSEGPKRAARLQCFLCIHVAVAVQLKGT